MSYYAQTATQVNQSERLAWLNELNQFHFPVWCKPHIDALEYVTYHLRAIRKKRQDCSTKENWIAHSEDLEPNEYYSLIVVIESFFAWLFTEDGSEWLLDLFGIEEVEPHHGYVYRYNNIRIGRDNESSIRIFNKNPFQRYHEPAYEKSGAIDDMKRILFKVYAQNTRKAPMYPSEGMWRWTLTAIRNWFTDPVDKLLPYPKSDRVSGIQWARQKKDPENQAETMWSVLEETEKYKPRAYRIEQRGGVIWCGMSQITAVPRDEDDYHQGIAAIRRGLLQLNEEQLIEKIHREYRCSSCDRVVCCTDRMERANNENLCDSCFGKHVEKGSRDTLDNCTYTECRGCPNHIRTTDDLKNLKYRLEQDCDFPVRR